MFQFKNIKEQFFLYLVALNQLRNIFRLGKQEAESISLNKCVVNGEINDEDDTALLRLCVMLSIPQPIVEAAYSDICDSFFEKDITVYFLHLNANTSKPLEGKELIPSKVENSNNESSNVQVYSNREATLDDSEDEIQIDQPPSTNSKRKEVFLPDEPIIPELSQKNAIETVEKLEHDMIDIQMLAFEKGC
ncbi:hypothetical protein Fmac_018130 [Flemingia macrophylla]|uniref:Uncharacterized protein n=1 Tax=Flemingia macrophylla TaxID=520843 RepID=A0ABD1M440_9FABA